MYTSTVLGEGKCVLFREVSLIQGVLLREVPLYIKYRQGGCSSPKISPEVQCLVKKKQKERSTHEAQAMFALRSCTSIVCLTMGIDTSQLHPLCICKR